MRSIAEFVMRGRMQATLAVAIMVVPGLFWFGAAIASLVLLRKGANQAISVGMVGLVIGLVSWYFERPTPLLVLLGALVLAQTLRITISWVYVLLVSVLISVGCYWLFYLNPTNQMAEMVTVAIAQFPEMLQQTYQITPEQSVAMAKIAAPIVIPLMYAIGIQLLSIVSLLVARYWQALLYNSGGFREEFYQLRMPIGVMTALVIGMLIVPNLIDSLVVLTFACSIPLVFAGLSLIHALFAKAQMNVGIVVFYIMFIVAIYVFYPLLVILAIVDSFLNLRKLPTKSAS